jgi:hypothetical protein
MGVLYSCGKCCHEEVPCDKCLVNTLAANALDKSLISEIKGLKHTSNYSGHNRTEYSELNLKINELKKNKLSIK